MKLKRPGIPSFIPQKYHHEIKCLIEQYHDDILVNILKNAKLDDTAFLQVSKFSSFGDCPIGVLKIVKDVKGNDVSKRLYEILTKGQANETD